MLLAGAPLASDKALPNVILSSSALGAGAIAVAPVAGDPTTVVVVRGGSLLGFGPLAAAALAVYSPGSPVILLPRRLWFTVEEHREEITPRRFLRFTPVTVAHTIFRPTPVRPLVLLREEDLPRLVRNHYALAALQYLPVIWVNT